MHRICHFILRNQKGLDLGRTVILISCILLFWSGSSFAQNRLFSFEIPSQDIQSALGAFTKVTDVSLVYRLEDLGNANANPVNGNYPPMEALGILLQGTGLIFNQISEETISIKKQQQQAKPESSEDTKTGQAALLASNGQTDVGAPAADQTKRKSYDDFMLDEMIITATKRPRKLQEVPISIYVLTGQQMESAGGGM